jgi:hypothetical protein
VAAGLLLAVSLGSAFGLWELSRLSDYLVRTSALESAAQQSEILDEVNNLYSADVVERAQLKGVVATHDYATRKDAIPLPATLTIDLGKHLSERSESGMQVRLYSDFPWRTRKDGGPKDDFERDALASLRQNPTEPYYRFEDFQGRPALRYARNFPLVIKELREAAGIAALAVLAAGYVLTSLTGLPLLPDFSSPSLNSFMTL